jgi:putative copper export protein
MYLASHGTTYGVLLVPVSWLISGLVTLAAEQAARDAANLKQQYWVSQLETAASGEVLASTTVETSPGMAILAMASGIGITLLTLVALRFRKDGARAASSTSSTTERLLAL